MYKKVLLLASIFVLAVLLLTACGQGATEAPSVEEPSTEVEEPAAEEPAAEEPKEEVTITYMASQGWIKDAELELAEKFETETGIHVDYQIIPADQYFNVLQTKLNAGEATDIFGGQSGKTDLKVMYDVEKNAVDLTDEEWAARMDPNAREMVSLNGKVYGAEIWDIIASNYFVMVYNKTIFDDLGISPPESYADFKGACETLMGAGIVPIYQPISDGWHHVLWFPMIGPRFEEVQPGLADQLNANEVTFAEIATMLDAMTQLNELYEMGCFGENAMADTFADANAKLASGEYAMSLTTLTAPTSIEADYGVPADTFGFFPIPLADNMLAPAHPAGPSKFIYSHSPHIEEAKQYLAFLMAPENLQYLLDNAPDFVSLDFSGLTPKWNAAQQEFLDTYPAKTMVYQDAVNYVNPQWMDIGKDMVAMFTDTMTPEEVLVSIDQRRAEMATTAKDPAWGE